MSKTQSLEEKLQLKLALRKQNNSLRVLHDKSSLIDFCSNDYLGFSQTLNVKPSTLSGATGSRLISGNSSQFEQLESKIANFHQSETALICNSGYDANIGLFSCIAHKGDTIIYDQYIHASIRDGIRLSKARSFSFEHNSLSSLQKKLEQASGSIIVAIESIYSMDGDCAPLEEIITLCEQYKAHIILDEAHAMGVLGEKGEGLAQNLQLQDKLFARVQTFGKAMGCHGAAILGSETLKNYLINYSRSFIYSTALAAHSLNSINAAYTKLTSDDDISNLHKNISQFKSLLSDTLKSKWIESESPIQCFLIPGVDEAKRVEAGLQVKGLNSRAILHPTVEEGKERIRICIHSFNSAQEIKLCVDSLEELIK